MFNSISFVIVILLLILIIIVGLTAIIKIRKSGQNQGTQESYNKTQFSDVVIYDTEIMYDKIASGKIRKHILANSGEYYDSTKTMIEYNIFLDSNLMQEYITERQESAYHG